jgi:hypothetical protein
MKIGDLVRMYGSTSPQYNGLVICTGGSSQQFKTAKILMFDGTITSISVSSLVEILSPAHEGAANASR